METFTHVGTIYRRSQDGTAWSQVAASVSCRGQPAGAGDVQQTDPGRVVTRQWWFRFASGVNLRPDDGFQITASWLASNVGKRLLVDRAGDWGFAGGLQADLTETEEEFT